MKNGTIKTIMVALITSGCTQAMETKEFNEVRIFKKVPAETTSVIYDQEEGLVAPEQKEHILRRANEVNKLDGIDIEEAKALVEKYLLEQYPKWTGWNIDIRDDGLHWKARCQFFNWEEHVEINRSNGLINGVYE